MRLAVILVCLLMLSSCSSDNLQYQDVAILKECSTNNEHYVKYTDGDKIYIKDVNNGIITEVALQNGEILEALELPYVITDQSYHEDPEDLGIIREFPTSYESSLELSASYLYSLISNGWDVEEFYREYEYCDYILRKEDLFKRVIIFRNKLKVFSIDGGNFENPYLYISR